MTKLKRYKLKTHKSTAKRFKLTGSGMLMRTKIGKGHLRRNTSKRTKALFSKMLPVQGKSYIKRIKRLAPYMARFKSQSTRLKVLSTLAQS
jgi:large subunit ribosomal protein L35